MTKQLPDCDVQCIGPWLVTTPTRTLIDVAADLDPVQLERTVESVLRLGQTSIPRLRWRAEELTRKGRSGPKAILSLLDARDRARRIMDGDLEVLFFRALRDAGLPLPEIQGEIKVDGRLVKRVDYLYPEQKVFVEVDGLAWHSDRATFESDRRVQNELVALGYRPFRVTHADVTIDRHRERMLSRLAEVLGFRRLF